MPKHHWATCLVTQRRFFPLYPDSTSCVSFCASCLWSCLYRKEPGSSSVHPSFRHSYSLMRFPSEAPLLQAECAQLCAFPHRGAAPVPLSSLQPLARLSIISLMWRTAHNWTQYLRSCITCAEWSGRITSKVALLMPLRCHQPSLPQGQRVCAGWCSVRRPPRPPEPFLEGGFLAGGFPAFTSTWNCFFPAGRFYISLCSSCGELCQPISPACLGPSGWQIKPFELLLWKERGSSCWSI